MMLDGGITISLLCVVLCRQNYLVVVCGEDEQSRRTHGQQNPIQKHCGMGEFLYTHTTDTHTNTHAFTAMGLDIFTFSQYIDMSYNFSAVCFWFTTFGFMLLDVVRAVVEDNPCCAPGKPGSR